MIRVFIAIELSGALKESIEFYQTELKKHASGVRWVKPENIHLTLKFLGEIEPEKVEEIQRVLKTVPRDNPAFSLNIKDFGVFPNMSKPRVFWLGVELNAAVINLHNTIETTLAGIGIMKDLRKFSPHLTLGRLKQPHNMAALLSYIKEYPFTSVRLNVSEFVLMQSKLKPEGAVYTPICRYSLDMYHN